ncbi:MAG TPA: ferritin-like domain-containing protein [Ferruginibacter sp.]|nr:ferritin-like domain-containing protein [Ferruginibacter sp.]
MNVQNIINQIEKVDPEVYEKLDTRRDVMKGFAKASGRIALAAIPLALGSMFQKAYGQSNTTLIADTLNFALTLEYIEANFYIKGVATSGLIPSPEALAALTTIRDHENAHVSFLRTAITSLGATPVTFTAAQFDFTAGGAFADVFSNYDTFLAVAQTFEDTGVRAYKGQAGNLMSNNDVLTAALNIHSVEARHAAHIRQMRKARGANVKPWITGNDSGIGPSVQASYNGEEITTQAGVNIVNIGGFTISSAAASEAFDEPLTKEQVTTIVTPFFA